MAFENCILGAILFLSFKNQIFVQFSNGFGQNGRNFVYLPFKNQTLNVQILNVSGF